MRRWTPEQDDLLTRLHGEGYSFGAIGDHMGITRNAAIGRAGRIGLPKRETRDQPRRKRRSKKRRSAPSLPGAEHPSAGTFNSPPVSVPADPLIEEPPDFIGPVQRHTILTLRSDMCRYPVGTPGDENFYFCGRPSCDRGSGSYCGFHAAICYQPLQGTRGDVVAKNRERSRVNQEIAAAKLAVRGA